MASNNENFPPGTCWLMEIQEAREAAAVILTPTPSNDPNDPLNWPRWRKYLNYGLIMAMTLAVFTNLMIQTVFWQQMSMDLDMTIPQLNAGSSAQLAGLSVGCLLFIPFTVKYGRRPTYIISTAVMAAVTWWISQMKSFPELILTNLISGLAGAINETAVEMTISDMFFVHQRATANALYFFAVMLGSFITPMAGGTQAAVQGWRMSYISLSIALTILTFLFIFAYEETKYVPVLGGELSPAVERRPESQDKSSEAGDKIEPNLSITKSNPAPPPEVQTYWQRMRLVTPTADPLGKIFVLPLYVITLPHVFFTALQFATSICFLVLFMSSISILFSMPPYNFTTAGVGYMSLGPFVGNIVGSFYGGPFSDWLVTRLARRNKGIFEPEMRLYSLLPPVLFYAGGMMMFGITVDRAMHWIYPAIAGAFFAFGLGSVGNITFTFVIDSYRDLTAEAFVGVAFLRNAVSVGIPFALVPWMTSFGVTRMWITAGAIGLAIGLLHIPMAIFGKKIRVALAPRYHKLVAKSKAIH